MLVSVAVRKYHKKMIFYNHKLGEKYSYRHVLQVPFQMYHYRENIWKCHGSTSNKHVTGSDMSHDLFTEE